MQSRESACYAQALSDLSKSVQIVPTSVEFVDIAGLVKGASKGEGLGNQFLANIRECDAIAQVVINNRLCGRSAMHADDELRVQGQQTAGQPNDGLEANPVH